MNTEKECENGKAKGLGLASGFIEDDHMSASSSFGNGWQAWRGRLGHTEGAGCWGPKENGQGEYLQVNLGQVREIVKVATQGRHESEYWTTAYKLGYSIDGKAWTIYNNVCQLQISFAQMVDLMYIRATKQRSASR